MILRNERAHGVPPGLKEKLIFACFYGLLIKISSFWGLFSFSGNIFD
jgi:hypothetical protein